MRAPEADHQHPLHTQLVELIATPQPLVCSVKSGILAVKAPHPFQQHEGRFFLLLHDTGGRLQTISSRTMPKL